MKDSEQQIVTEGETGGAQRSTLAVERKKRPLRTWPALALVGLMLLARYVPGFLEGGLSSYWMIAVFGPLLCCVLLLIWWLTASRATWKERVFGFLGLIAGLALTVALVHPTMRGPGTTYLTAPMGMILFAIAAWSLAGRSPVLRTGFAVLLALGGFGYSTLLRNEGMTGEYRMETHWRWSRTPEAAMLAARRSSDQSAPQARSETNGASPAAAAEALAKPEWPGFRGADRSGHSRGPALATDWSTHPPRQLWKISVGPAWSSFAVAGRMLFTQEQRGPMETVVCYDTGSGREIWVREFEARLEDPLGGPGPRATPTLANGGLFATGATGTFMRLDPLTGAIVWQHDLKEIAGRTVPLWGFSASPLVTGSLVLVYGGGSGDKGLLAFDASSGTLRWSVPAGTDSYSSPQLSRIAGEELVLLLSNDGLVGADPASGAVRLNYEWKVNGYRALQPAVIDNTILLPSPMNPGTRAVQISKDKGQLAAEELWTSRLFKPDFTDFVAHEGYLYGIDGGFLACVDPKTGERKWKGGRYGKGQVLLVENPGLLLVLAEDGRVVLARANPGEHVEIASYKALEGKTWNHPVLVGNRLYVRNSQEAAAYEVPLAEAKSTIARF